VDLDGVGGGGCSVPVPFCSTLEARPLGVFSASAGGAATSGGAGMSSSAFCAIVVVAFFLSSSPAFFAPS